MKLLPCPNECGVAILQKLGEGGAEENFDTPTFQAIRGEPPLPTPPPPPAYYWNVHSNDALLPPPPPGVFHQRALDHDPHHMQLHCTFLLSDGKWCKVSCSRLKKLMVCFFHRHNGKTNHKLLRLLFWAKCTSKFPTDSASSFLNEQ